MVSSTDGYCSIITFAPGELGVPYESSEEASTKKTSDTINTITEAMVSASGSGEVQEETSVQSDLALNSDLTKDEEDFDGIKKLEEVVLEDDSGSNIDQGKMVECEKSRENFGVETGHTVTGEPSNNQCASPNVKANVNGTDSIKSCSATPTSGVPALEEVVTPGNSGKKARRVPLITLSSPKSKKKLL